MGKSFNDAANAVGKDPDAIKSAATGGSTAVGIGLLPVAAIGAGHKLLSFY